MAASYLMGSTAQGCVLKEGREVGKDLAPLQRFIRTNFALRGQPHLVKEVFGNILFYDASLQVFLY